MSHIVEIQTEIRDPVAVRAACQRLGLPPAVDETVTLYSGQARGLAVRLPGWRYPVVCNPVTGDLRYDNFNGRWGQQHELDRFLQRYAVEKTRIEAHRKGHRITEQVLADGSIKLSIQIHGDAA